MRYALCLTLFAALPCVIMAQGRPPQAPRIPQAPPIAEPVPAWTWTPRPGTEGRYLDLTHGSHWWGTLDRADGQFWCPLPESGGRYLRGRVPVAAPEPPPTTYQRYVEPQQTFAPPMLFAAPMRGGSC